MTRASVVLLVAVLVAAGVVLRVEGLDAQIVADDEMHSLRALLATPPADLLTQFFPYAVSTPQTLLQLAIARAIGLDEVTVRLPMLLAGIAALVFIPLWTWRLYDGRTALLLLALLAVSPQLVHYSRYGRPYMIATLLVFGALYAFALWWTRGGRARAAAFVLCGACAVWFHLLAAPTVVSALGVAGAAALAGPRGERTRRVRQLAGPALALAALLILLLAAPLTHLDARLPAKVGAGRPELRTLGEAALLFAGTASIPLAVLVWAGVVAGLAIGCVRNRFASALFATALLVQPLAVWLLAPTSTEIWAVFARYCEWVLPIALLFLALAVTALGDLAVAGARGLSFAVAALLVVALYAAGPLPAIYGALDNFTNHAELQGSYGPLAVLPERLVPPFYRALAREPGRFAIVETPWFFQWPSNRFRRYQRIHGKDVLIGFFRPEPGVQAIPIFDYPFGGPLHFRRFVDLEDPTALDGRDVRYVIFHKALKKEMGWRREPSSRPLPDLGPHLAEFAARFGVPVYEDGWIAVFRVAPPGS